MSQTHSFGIKPPVYPGFDILRLLGMVLVTIQHMFSLLGLEEWANGPGLTSGQVGVGIFLALSGFLAGQAQGQPLPWLWRRFARIFPAYWVVTMLALFLAWMMQTKDFDLAQALSQMAGLGLFTHGNNLINSPTWFVSVLLVCYVLSAIARATGHTTWVATGLGIAAMGLALWEEPDFIGMSFLAFGMGFLRARIQARRVFVVGSLAFLLGMCFMDGIPFVSLILAVLALESGLLMRSVSHVVQRASQFSYEYFLLHGLGLHAGLAMVPQTPLLGISVGVLLAILASVALHLLLARLGRTVQSLPIPLTVLGHRKHPRGFDTH